MATLNAFEAALNDVIAAKRLSQSKMDTLTESALKCIENDTKMVLTLHRTHQGLSPSGKGRSLYAFDALARAARHQVNKNNLVADMNSERGNCATFLRRLESILDGFFQDLVSSGNEDLKAKAKKILDIWTNSNTFPPTVLSPLYALLQQAENEKEPDSAVQSANPPPNPLSAPAVAPLQAIPATGNVDLQSTLLALLSKAANSVGANGTLTSQTAPNIAVAPPVPAPVLDANQLALLQHLAQAAQGNVMSTLPAVPVLPPSVVPNAVDVVPPVHRDEPVPASGSNQLPYYQDDRFGHASASASASAYAPHPESEQQPQHMHGGRFDGPPDRGYPRDDYYDQSQHQPAASHPHEYGGNDPRRGGAYGNTHRGGYRDRGGPGPGRGRGRGRRDDYGGDRDYNDHDHGDSYGTAPNGSYDHPRGFGRRSRSRSPPGRFRGGSGGGGRGMNGNGRGRDARPYSPPRRPRNRGRSRGGGRDKVDANIAAGFDEFGRELRAASPARSMAGSETASASASASAGPLPTLGERSRGESPLPPGSVTTSDRGSSAPEHPSQAFEVGGGGGMHRSYSDHQDYRSSPDLSTSTPYQTSPSSMSMSTAHPGTEGGGLDGFDRASFDPSQASSWDALGKAWTATHGSMPSQEELMQFVFGNVSLPPSGSGQSAGQSEDLYGGADGPGGSPQQSRRQLHEEGEQQWTSGRGYGQQRGGWRGRGGGGGDGDAGRGYGRGRGGGDYGRGRGGFGGGGRGDYGYGPRRERGDHHGRDDHGQENGPGLGYGRGDYGGPGRGGYNVGGRGDYGDYHDTDAITLTGDSGDYSNGAQDMVMSDGPSQWQAPSQPLEATPSNQGGGGTGKMQKVGDKWMFVRGAA